MSILEKLLELEKGQDKAALCTVVAYSGSTPRKTGAKMIVVKRKDTYQTFGTIGGGAIEYAIFNKALLLLDENKPAQLVTTSLGNELGMCCGGEMTVFIEPVVKKSRMILFGAGHIGAAIYKIIRSLEFFVTVVDERKEFLAKPEFLGAELSSSIDRFSIKSLPFSDQTFVVIATHDHKLDQTIAEAILQVPFKYAALVGSQRKALMTKKRLAAKGYSEQKIARIRCPAGISINAITPEEIAISIVAQMIQVKNEQ